MEEDAVLLDGATHPRVLEFCFSLITKIRRTYTLIFLNQILALVNAVLLHDVRLVDASVDLNFGG